MPKSPSFYVTTPIYYVNDAPHIGHSYTNVAADVLARWHRQRSESVFFLTGTDEHGNKVEQSALDADVTPQEWVDRLVTEEWIPALEVIDASNDDFIRTTSGRHKKGVNKFWAQLRESGYIYEGTYEGPYCVGCEEFKLPGDLIEDAGGGPKLCAIHGRPVEMLSEPNWFFKLSAFSDKLVDHYTRHPEALQPQSAYNEVMSFIKGGLEDISMSRASKNVSWGIPLEWDDSQVVYVWFDALLNYLTAIGYGADPDTPDGKKFAQIWPANVQLVGKDILRFHAIFWPAMLMAAELELPKTVFAHGWLLVGGEKMSKTKLTGIHPSQIVDDFGSDAFRYYFMRAIQFGQDGSFSWEDMAARYQADLANGIGNLASRATAMVNKYCDGVLPEPGTYSNADLALADDLVARIEKADAAMLRLAFSDGLAEIMAFVDALNLYVTEQQPWVLAKDESQATRLNTVLYVICDSLRSVAIALNPTMPKAMKSLWGQLGAQPLLGELADATILSAMERGKLTPGSVVTKGAPLFPRIEVPSSEETSAE